MKFGENVKTTMAGALKCRGGLLRDNLRNSLERKASWHMHVENNSWGPKTKPSWLEELVRHGT